MKNKTIKDWNEDDRPREKLLHKGPTALSDAELLAIIIGSGTTNFSALQVAQEILALTQNNIHDLGRLSVQELQKVKGIGEARAISIASALELGRRRQQTNKADKPKFTDSRQLFEWLQPQMQDLQHEIMIVLYLNRALQLIRQDTISQGGIDAMHVDIRMILKNALLYQASQIVVAHNHPSGNKTPSEADKKLTEKLVQSAAMMEVPLIDHIIIARSEYFSFADAGWI